MTLASCALDEVLAPIIENRAYSHRNQTFVINSPPRPLAARCAVRPSHASLDLYCLVWLVLFRRPMRCVCISGKIFSSHDFNSPSVKPLLSACLDFSHVASILLMTPSSAQSARSASAIFSALLT